MCMGRSYSVIRDFCIFLKRLRHVWYGLPVMLDIDIVKKNKSSILIYHLHFPDIKVGSKNSMRLRFFFYKITNNHSFITVPFKLFILLSLWGWCWCMLCCDQEALSNTDWLRLIMSSTTSSTRLPPSALYHHTQSNINHLSLQRRLN